MPRETNGDVSLIEFVANTMFNSSSSSSFYSILFEKQPFISWQSCLLLTDQSLKTSAVFSIIFTLKLIVYRSFDYVIDLRDVRD